MGSGGGNVKYVGISESGYVDTLIYPDPFLLGRIFNQKKTDDNIVCLGDAAVREY